MDITPFSITLSDAQIERAATRTAVQHFFCGIHTQNHVDIVVDAMENGHDLHADSSLEAAGIEVWCKFEDSESVELIELVYGLIESIIVGMVRIVEE